MLDFPSGGNLILESWEPRRTRSENWRLDLIARCAKRRRPRRDRPAIRRPVLANAEFNVLFDDGTVYEAACWAHARRKFFDLHEARPSALTAEAPRRIAKLYVIEAEIRGKPPHE